MLRGNVQSLRKDAPVAGRLIEQANEVAVFQNVFDLRGRKQVFDVLGRPGRDASPFSESLPNLAGESCRLFLSQKQMELVAEVPRRLALAAVLGHAAPNLVLDNEHPQLFELFSQLFNIKSHNAVLNVDVGAVVKDVQAAVYIQVKGLRHTVGLRDMLV